jgi:hypothetical protein
MAACCALAATGTAKSTRAMAMVSGVILRFITIPLE